MSSYYYPPVDGKLDAALGSIRAQALEHPDYFEDEDCPYSDKLKFFFGTMARKESTIAPEVYPEKEKDAKDEMTQDEMDDAIVRESYFLLMEIRAYGKGLTKEDQTEKMSYFRTAAGLIQKMTDIRAKALGVKQVKEFQDIVVQAMEDVLTPEQRTNFMSNLRNFKDRVSAENTDPETSSEDLPE